MNTVPFQTELRPELPNVYGVSDYREFRDTLIKINELLEKSGLEQKLISLGLDQYVQKKGLNPDLFYTSRKAALHYKKLRHALRCNIARHLTGESYRLFSIRIADSTLFQWFMGISAFENRKAISKSTLERYEKYFDEGKVAEVIRSFLSDLTDEEKASEVGLAQAIECKKLFMDSTCIRANIHFPVDWVLLRDAARSLLLAIKTIRAKGLKSRMIDPMLFLKQMNKLSIQMTHTRRKPDSKRQRKIIFRAMKKLSHCIAKHGLRYRELLRVEWTKTDWTCAQALQVIRRMDLILEQLPAAIRQAHERIIGERLVLNEEKILSLYDPEAYVIVRGKAGSEVEFGQGLLLTEQVDGLIIDWKFFADHLPSDNQLIKPALRRMKKHYGAIESICADRAFSDKKHRSFFQAHHIYDAICPKSPKQLQEKLSDPLFLSLQTRRSQTEARIGIFKNVFLRNPLRSRITAYKQTAITWCVLTHNLWLLSRKILDIEKTKLMKAA